MNRGKTSAYITAAIVGAIAIGIYFATIALNGG
jgi:inner membrane protein involved in colicin E2 resistance